MSQRVKFFCKLTVNKKKEKKVFVHSICRTAQSLKFVFDNEERPLNKHLKGVQDAITAADVKSKRHVDYTLKGSEIAFYINPETSNFWYNGKELKKVPAISVSSKPSEEQEDLETEPSRIKATTSCTLKRQVAVEKGKTNFFKFF